MVSRAGEACRSRTKFTTVSVAVVSRVETTLNDIIMPTSVPESVVSVANQSSVRRTGNKFAVKLGVICALRHSVPAG